MAQEVELPTAMGQRERDETEFNYEKHVIEATSHHIQLVQIFPAIDIKDDICCTILISCLDDSPVYEAVSYAWEEPR